ncbi:hypothetical protein BJ1_gp30 [Halorubrum virus BJ1]|uniref:Uncharacterized protein n=1 Tax=Halorubrum virus BJ1 TaxID=416419 RepID=A0ZYP3_9CAUD|nr:hypothetical protein BJ1_gp30 [Halorubrum virus BJ1]CAL92452.1 hypothetical protein [Halorubrum virus BJ1]
MPETASATGDLVKRREDLRVVEGVHDFDETHRVLLVEHGELLVEPLFTRLFGLDGFLRERVATPTTSRPIGLVELVTADALLHRGRVVGDVDVDAVRARDGVVGGVVEDSDVASCLIGAADPAVVVLDEGLVDVLSSEIARRALPELRRRRRRRRVHRRVAREALQRVSEVVAGDALRRVEPTPEVVVTVARMAFEPVADVGCGLDDRRRARAVLAVLDGDAQAVVGFGDVRDLELVQLGGAGAEVPAEGDKCLVANVARGVDHRLHMLLPSEHLTRVGRRVVGIRVASGHPRDRVRRLFAARRVSTEGAEALPVIPVGLFVVVGPLDPADDLLGRLTLLKGVSETPDLASHLDGTHENVAVVALREPAGAEQLHLTVGVEDGLSVGLGHLVALLTPLDVAVDRVPRLIGHTRGVYYWACKHHVWSPPRPYTILLTCPVINPSSEGSGQPRHEPRSAESSKLTPHTAIASSSPAAGTEVTA